MQRFAVIASLVLVSCFSSVAEDITRVDIQDFWVPAGLKPLTLVLQKNFDLLKAGDLASGSISATEIAGRAVTGAKLPIMTVGQVLAGQADSNAVAKTLSGAVTIDANGVATLAPTSTVANAVNIGSRPAVVGAATGNRYQVYHYPAATNTQVISFNECSALPSVSLTYASTSATWVVTNVPLAKSVTTSNLVVSCDEGKTVDAFIYGLRQ